MRCRPSMRTAVHTGFSVLLPSTTLPDLSPQGQCDLLMGATVLSSVGVSSQNKGPVGTVTESVSQGACLDTS